MCTHVRPCPRTVLASSVGGGAGVAVESWMAWPRTGVSGILSQAGPGVASGLLTLVNNDY